MHHLVVIIICFYYMHDLTILKPKTLFPSFVRKNPVTEAVE